MRTSQQRPVLLEYATASDIPFDQTCGEIKLSAVKDLNWQSWSVVDVCGHLCDLVDGVHAVDDLTEDHVFAVQMWTLL